MKTGSEPDTPAEHGGAIPFPSGQGQERECAASGRLGPVGVGGMPVPLAAGVTHDVNNFLTVILCQGEIALAGLSPDDPLRRFLEEIIRAAAQGAFLTRKILDFSRTGTPNPVLLDLNAVIGDLDPLLRGLVGHQYDFVRDLTPYPARVRADRKQLEQILATLVFNRREALPPGACVTVETMHRVLAQPLTHQYGSIPAGLYIRLSVRDNGPDLDNATLTRWLDAAQATTSDEPTIPFVHQLVRQNSGFLHAESRQGQGTAVSVYLPQAEKQGAVSG
jgi:two-component system, cell cycle sensor histidine kinase and response regulator CckA